VFSSSGITPFTGGELHGNIREINGVEMDAYDFQSNWKDAGGLSIHAYPLDNYSVWGEGYMVLGGINPYDKIEYGYYDGTTYMTDEISADIWIAFRDKEGYSSLYLPVWDLDITETKNGYFELRMKEDLNPGLYMLYFGGDTEEPMLVWYR